jgi:hypothetical protein
MRAKGSPGGLPVMMRPPIPYSSSFEALEQHEGDTQSDILDTLQKIQQTTYAQGERPLRAMHAKSFGLLRGMLTVLPDLAPELAQGLFQRAIAYPLVMRLSTSPGDVVDDSLSTPRGLAIKVWGVQGPRLCGSVDEVTQDFVLMNGAGCHAKNGEGFARGLKLQAQTTDKAPSLKKIVSGVLRGTESLVERATGKNPALVNFGGQRETHPLGDAYYSVTPYLYGHYMAKFCVAPISPQLRRLTDRELVLKDSPDGLRDAVMHFFGQHGGVWELRVQLCTDLQKMPVEDASVVWPEEESPYVPVARIEVPAQQAWSEERSRVIDEGYSFSPWHGLAAHRPLGSINRLRKQAYEEASRFRRERSGMLSHEPVSFDRLPD